MVVVFHKLFGFYTADELVVGIEEILVDEHNLILAIAYIHSLNLVNKYV